MLWRNIGVLVGPLKHARSSARPLAPVVKALGFKSLMAPFHIEQITPGALVVEVI